MYDLIYIIPAKNIFTTIKHFYMKKISRISFVAIFLVIANVGISQTISDSPNSSGKWIDDFFKSLLIGVKKTFLFLIIFYTLLYVSHAYYEQLPYHNAICFKRCRYFSACYYRKLSGTMSAAIPAPHPGWGDSMPLNCCWRRRQQ